MTPTPRMTRAREQRWYRYAVQASLEQFYGKSRAEASQLVRAWWKRLAQSGVLKSDLFLHDEPMNSAAGIAEVRVIPITAKNREAYHRVLNQSRDLVLSRAQPRPKQTEPAPTKKDAQPQTQLAPLAT